MTLDDPRSTRLAVDVARRAWPQLPVFARARDARHAAELVKLGVTDPVPEATEASLTLGGRLLAELGIPPDCISRRLEEIRLDEVATVTPDKRRAEEAPPAAGQ